MAGCYHETCPEDTSDQRFAPVNMPKHKLPMNDPRLPGAPPLSGARAAWRVPDDGACMAWWDDFHMPGHIRRHSLKVAELAEAMAVAAVEAGVDTDVKAVRASALLHDLAKIYTIEHGGHHGQLGGAWVMELTGHPEIAQGVIHHVYWPFEVVDLARHFLPLAVCYADKRVMHDEFATLDERFDDLFVRYGKTPFIRARMRENLDMTRHMEELFNRLLEVDLDACVADSGRLVERT